MSASSKQSTISKASHFHPRLAVSLGEPLNGSLLLKKLKSNMFRKEPRMQNPHLYLKRNAQSEPLISQWYAWPHLIPPATAARNITERCFRIMDSYVAAPALHAAAVKNPKMLGGPFVDLGGKRVA